MASPNASSSFSEAIDCGPSDGLATEGRMLVRAGEVEVLVVSTRLGVFAVENRCPHIGRSLSDGVLSGRTLTCPGHGYRYDLASGHAVGSRQRSLPGVRPFVVEIRDGHLWLFPAATASDVRGRARAA